MISEKCYKLDLEIEFVQTGGASTPVRVELDFDSLLDPSHRMRLIDPHTLIVKRRLDGKVKRYNVQFAETLYSSNRGWVAWLVDCPQRGGKWRLEFSLRSEKGEMARAPYMPMVGVGDEMYFNGKQRHPICVPGMHQFPMAVDWDGDGLIDIISSSHYSNTYNMPSSGIFFWRNIGSNKQPQFGPPMRIYADGVDQTDPYFTHLRMQGKDWRFEPRRDFISEYYIRCDLFDWFGAGLTYLITASMHAGIRVYRNTGKIDTAGMPELKLSLEIPLPEIAATSIVSIRVVDWDGSGKPSILLGVGSQILLMHFKGGMPYKPEYKIVPLRNSAYAPHVGGWESADQFPDGRTGSIDYFDVDEDGKKELLVCHSHHRPLPVIELWRNVGTLEEPVMMQDGHLSWSSHYHTFGFRFVKNIAFSGCLFASTNSGAGMHYFKRVKSSPFGKDSFRDTGPLPGEGCKIKVEGYVKPYPVDPGIKDGLNNGGFDLICGDEPGFITLIKNTGTKEKPVFNDPQKISDSKGKILHLCRENILHDNNPEWICGQLKPVVCDWDGDGRLDIIVGNNTNHIFWLEGYDPAANRFCKLHRLIVKGIANPFGWRKGPDVIDFDGDGKLELIAVDALQRICMYKQVSGKGKHVMLDPPAPLTYSNGRAITTDDIPPTIYRNAIVNIAVCDWTGTGSHDLIISTNYMTSLLENVGTNKAPKFKEPVPFKTPDGVIEICHHESHAVAYDWDNDGRPDLLIGGESGSIYVFHRDWLEGIIHRVRQLGCQR